MSPSVEAVEREGDFVRVRFADPNEFETIRTPDWAERPAGDVVKGAGVRTGKESGDDDWSVRSVLIPKDVDDDEARNNAVGIVEKIESK